MSLYKVDVKGEWQVAETGFQTQKNKCGEIAKKIGKSHHYKYLPPFCLQYKEFLI